MMGSLLKTSILGPKKPGELQNYDRTISGGPRL
jgi:hypothetical protein